MLRSLRTHAHHPSLEASVIALARAGGNGLLWHGLAVAGIAFHGERRPVYIRFVGAVLTTLAANSAVKLVVRRALALGRVHRARSTASPRPWRCRGPTWASTTRPTSSLLGDAMGRMLTP